MLYACFVELHVAVNYIKILSLAQQCFFGKCMSQAAIKRKTNKTNETPT